MRDKERKNHFTNACRERPLITFIQYLLVRDKGAKTENENSSNCYLSPCSSQYVSAHELDGWVGDFSFIFSLCSQSGRQTKRLVLDPSSKLPLYKQTSSVKAPSPAKQSQGSGNQAKSQDSSAVSGGQYCIYQKPKQVTCSVAHMKRVTNKYKYYCGTRSQGKVCTGYR